MMVKKFSPAALSEQNATRLKNRHLERNGGLLRCQEFSACGAVQNDRNGALRLSSERQVECVFKKFSDCDVV